MLSDLIFVVPLALSIVFLIRASRPMKVYDADDDFAPYQCLRREVDQDGDVRWLGVRRSTGYTAFRTREDAEFEHVGHQRQFAWACVIGSILVLLVWLAGTATAAPY